MKTAQTPEGGQLTARAIRGELAEVTDQKLRRITAMLDEASDPALNRTILDPLRGRLAMLRPARPLRFTRLLFIPLDPLIVAARAWKPGEPSIPRSILVPLGNMVHAAMGADAVRIEQNIGHSSAAEVRTVNRLGAALWPRAAEILAAAPIPPGWADTGLAQAAYQPLAQAIAAVLRRAVPMSGLVRDAELGALEADEYAVKDIMASLAGESAEGRAMIIRLVLLYAPHAGPVVRRFVALHDNAGVQKTLRQALAQGVDQVLGAMEAPAGLTSDIGRASLSDVGGEVRRIVSALAEIEADPGAAYQRPRIAAIRQSLDRACRSRFAEGLRDGLVAPLAVASMPIGGDGQEDLEACSRNLRALETEGRKLAANGLYDRMLEQASTAVLAASAAGTLTPIRMIRLVEILSGPETAEALYRRQKGAA